MLALLITICSSVYAAGGSSGSPSDLIPSFVNLGLLLVGIIYLTREKLSNFFQEESKKVNSIMERASVKAKEADLMLKMQNEKLKNLDAEIQKIFSENDRRLVDFENNYKNETQEKIVALKKDATNKVEAEKKQLLNSLNAQLVESLIDKTKEKVKTDKAMSEKVTLNLLKGDK